MISCRPLPVLAVILLLAVAARADDNPGQAPLRTFDGKHSIQSIQVAAVYYVPEDRKPLPDWRERVEYFTRRIEAFHRRELSGLSDLRVAVHAEPLRSKHASEHFRGKDANVTFFRTMDDVRKTLGWPAKERKAFPILLVFSDINWRELDDFRRERLVEGKPQHEGNIAGDGRHFPGAESGGARAVYDSRGGYGMGLVSADGWRVPYSGSDCVAYHEGVGHPIGLPHPDPIDDSVMGVAQYRFWLNQSHVNVRQKKVLGWKPPSDEGLKPDLFTAFTALQDPVVPAPGQRVELKLTWPKDAQVKSIKVRYQTDLWGPWWETPMTGVSPTAPAKLALATFDQPTPVSYRVDAALASGETVELWGYFQVRDKRKGK